MSLWWFVYIVNKLTPTPLRTTEDKVALCQRLVSLAPRIIVGNFDNLEFKTIEEFLSTLQMVIYELEEAALNPFIITNTRLDVVLARARDVEVRITLGLRDDFVRKQPFGILVAGPPGSGKTFGSQNLAIKLYNLNHEKPATKQDIVVLNEGDEYQSEFRSSHRIVLFDDLGATSTSYYPSDPFRKVIDFINNVPKTALNPHLDLKGNVWINPDIVVATTNLFIPFTKSNNDNNTQVIQCIPAINRRFPVKIWQQGYDEFYLVDDDDTKLGDKKADGSHYTQRYKRLNFEQLFLKVKDRYINHVESQEEFVKMVEDQVRPEGLGEQVLKFSTITTLQALARLSISLKSREGDDGLAMLLVSLRRLAAIPLLEMKNSARMEVVTRLISLGLTGRDANTYTMLLEKICKYGPVLYRMHIKSEDLTKLQNLADVLSPILEESINNNISRPLPYEVGSYMYDILSVCLPKVTCCVIQILDLISQKLFTQQEVVAEGEVHYNTLSKTYDFQWVSTILAYYGIESFTTIELYSNCFILDNKVSYSKTSLPLDLEEYSKRPHGLLLSEKEFRELVEWNSKVRPEGASGQRTVQFVPATKTHPLDVRVYPDDHRRLAIHSLYGAREVPDYFARKFSLSSLLFGNGAARRKHLVILPRVDYSPGRFIQGSHTFVFDEVDSVFYVFKTVKKSYRVNLSYLYDFLKFVARENTVVFCGRNEKNMLITPLFSKTFKDPSDILGQILRVNSLSCDILKGCDIPLKDLNFLIGKAMFEHNLLPLPPMKEIETYEKSKLKNKDASQVLELKSPKDKCNKGHVQKAKITKVSKK